MRKLPGIIALMFMGTWGHTAADMTLKHPASLTKTSFAGIVQTVDTQSNLIKVADDAGHILQLTANSSTQVLKDNKPISIAALRPHDQVVVQYWVDTSTQ